MSEIEFEARVQILASQMDYPHTPDIAGRVRTQLRPVTSPRFTSKAAAWSLTFMLVLCSSLMLIPSARAAIIEFFQVGIIRIFPPTATPTAQPIRTAAPETLTPGPTLPSLLPLLENIAGKTELEEAQQRTEYSILFPTYPSDLGLPDYVYVQNAEGFMTILVWMDPGQPERVLMSLHFIPDGSWAIHKMGPQMIRETKVNGQYAIWAEGPYALLMHDGDEVERVRLVDGHVLIWENDGVTYRLESDLEMDEAIKVAESLEPLP